MLTICWAMSMSSVSSFWSIITKKRSNLDMIGGEMATLYLNVRDASYLPIVGLAAARMDVRAFKVA